MVATNRRIKIIRKITINLHEGLGGGAGGGVWNSLISKYLAHFSLSLKLLLTLINIKNGHYSLIKKLHPDPLHIFMIFQKYHVEWIFLCPKCEIPIYSTSQINVRLIKKKKKKKHNVFSMNLMTVKPKVGVKVFNQQYQISLRYVISIIKPFVSYYKLFKHWIYQLSLW